MTSRQILLSVSAVLLFAMTSTLNATVIDVVTDGLGDQGHTGTSSNPLKIGEIIDIKIVLNQNFSCSSYPGFNLTNMDLTLQVAGAGSLGATYVAKSVNTLAHNSGFSTWTNTPATPTGVNQMTGASLSGILGPADLVWDMFITTTNSGPIISDLSLYGSTQYYDCATIPPLRSASNSDLGDLAIYVAQPGDIDNNCDVDFVDFSKLGAEWGKTACGTCNDADLTGDNKVDANDLAELAAHWLKDCTTP